MPGWCWDAIFFDIDLWLSCQIYWTLFFKYVYLLYLIALHRYLPRTFMSFVFDILFLIITILVTVLRKTYPAVFLAYLNFWLTLICHLIKWILLLSFFPLFGFVLVSNWALLGINNTNWNTWTLFFNWLTALFLVNSACSLWFACWKIFAYSLFILIRWER